MLIARKKTEKTKINKIKTVTPTIETITITLQVIIIELYLVSDSNSTIQGHLQRLRFATGSKFVGQLAADNSFYVPLTVEKMHAFATFNDFDLRLYSCSDTNYTVAVNCTNPRTETLTDI